jgi:hypothetical protein
MKSLLLLCCFTLFALGLDAGERGSSAPYISGDTFRAFCKFHYDELSKSLHPAQVKTGDTVFVKTDYLEEYFKLIHPQITHPYILVTHNSDHPIPGNFAPHLDDPLLFAWFGQNVENYSHPKLHPIPIGLANRCWRHGDIELVKKVQSYVGLFERQQLAYMNFTEGTFPTERSLVAKLFQDRPFCVKEAPKPYDLYLQDLAKSKFVFSPRGNGIDCHRTWESLLMGAYPIVKTSALDPVYEGLPVVIVKEWEEINGAYLRGLYTQMRAKSYNLERAYSAYWLDLITKAQQEARSAR